MRAVAIDDDVKMHRLLGRMLQQTDSAVEIVGTATSVDTGVQLIEDEKPDLLFLDIDLGDSGTGFDILHRINSGEYLIIFISGHNEYGQLALHFEALDYLNKPLKSTDLVGAIARAQLRFNQRSAHERIADLELAISNFHEEKLPTRLTVSTSQGIYFLPVEDILRISCKDGVVTFHCVGGRTVHKSDRLKRYDEKFQLYPEFMLVHQSNLVNLKRVHALKPGPVLLMEDDAKVTLTPQSAKRVKLALENL